MILRSRRLVFLAACLLAGLLLGVTSLGTGWAATEEPAGQGVQVDLRTQLTKGLKARLPAEFAFIDRVVVLVNTNRLPRRLVDSAFLWARRKPKNKVEYFHAALVRLAAREGIDI